jgi:low temperature requirement protein LtrA
MASLLAPEDMRPALWAAAVAIEVLTPVVGWRRLGAAAAAEEHLQERCGLFTLIVLGEVVVRTVDSLEVVHWDGRAWSAVLAVALIVVCVWWLTFDFVETTVPPGLRALAYLSAHIPTYIAIAALGVGVELAFHHVDDGALVEQGRWILCGAAALYLFSITCIRATADRRLHVLAIHPFAAAVLLGVAAAGDSLSAPAVLYVVAGVLVAELLYKGTVLGWSGGLGEDEDERVSGGDGSGARP